MTEESKGGTIHPEDEIDAALAGLEEQGKKWTEGKNEKGVVGDVVQPIGTSSGESVSSEVKVLADQFSEQLRKQEEQPVEEDVEVKGVRLAFDAKVKEIEAQRDADIASVRAHLEEIPSSRARSNTPEISSPQSEDPDLDEVTRVYARKVDSDTGITDKSLADIVGGAGKENIFSREDGVAMAGREIRGIQGVIRELIESALESGDQSEIDEAFKEAAAYRKKQEELVLGIEGAKDRFPETARPVLVDIDTFRAEFESLISRAKKDPSQFGFK